VKHCCIHAGETEPPSAATRKGGWLLYPHICRGGVRESTPGGGGGLRLLVDGPGVSPDSAALILCLLHCDVRFPHFQAILWVVHCLWGQSSSLATGICETQERFLQCLRNLSPSLISRNPSALAS